MPAFRLISLRVALTAFTVVMLTCAFRGDAALSMGDPHVIDGGMFFSEEAVSEADDVIRSIKQAYDRDVVVDTYDSVPDELRDDLARDGKEKFYEDWLNRRAKQLGVHGVFVLMTREPGRVQVGVDRPTRQRAFTVADREALREILAGAFRARQFDRGLLDGLRFVRGRMAENTSAERGPTVPVLSASAQGREPAKSQFSP